MQGDGGTDAQAEDGGRDEKGDHAEADPEVLADDAVGLPAQADGEGQVVRSSAIRATSAVSRATSDPAAPIAMPTVALAIAGASFTPSPTIATRSSSSSTS